MTIMKKLAFLAAALLLAGAAAAQEPGDDPYEFILAKLAADDGHFDDALSRLDKIAARHPDNSVLHYERAMILIDASRTDQAEGELKKAIALQPSFYDAERVLGRVILDRAGNDRGRIDEALTHLQAAYRINPDDLPTGMAVSQILLSTGRTADAEKVLATLLERAPDQRGLNYNYALVLTKLGRGDESRKYLERAVEVDPTFGPAIMQLLDIYQRSNEFERAAQLLEAPIKDDPTNLGLQKDQALFYLRAGQAEKARAAYKTLSEADPKDNGLQYHLAEALSDLERYDEADAIYRKLMEKTPDDPELLASFGLAQMGQKKLDDAAKTFRTLLALPDVPDNLVALGKTQLAIIELQKGNYGAAFDAAKDILVFRDHPNPQGVNVAVEALKKQKRYPEIVALLQPLADKYAGDPFVNARYIEALLRTGDKDRARVAASTQTKFGVRNTISAAEAYMQVEQYEAALSILRDGLKTKSDDLDLQYALASAYERSGDKANAEKAFLDILQGHPDHAPTLNYLGYMWAEDGRNLDRAAEMLNKAVTQEPRNGAYVDSLGWVYFRLGQLDLAEKYLNDAVHLLPRDATVQQHLGDVLARRGDYQRALRVYRAALTLDPEAKDEAKLKSKIAELEKQQVAKQTR
jgi:tetratricopeptide (TPR) repeat protein